MSEEEKQAWAAWVMDKINDVQAMALHIAGWKIISRDGDNAKWPFGVDGTECDCPDWCSDTTHLRRTEG